MASTANVQPVKWPTDIDDQKTAAAMRLVYSKIEDINQAITSLKEQLTAAEARITALGG